MSLIKKFFQKRKLDIKFKKAGSGHKLAKERSAPGPSHGPSGSGARSATSKSRMAPSDEAQRAAEAAMARSEQPKPGSSIGGVKAQVRREIEAERRATEQARLTAETDAGPKELLKDGAPMLSSVLFKCPDIGPAVLPKTEMDVYIEEFLLSQLADEPEMTSALMIQTLNKDREKVKICVETLCKYIDNVLQNPDEKFRKIRITNKAFEMRVKPCRGTEEFLQAAGFRIRRLPFETGEEDFYVLTEEYAKDTDRLNMLKEALVAAEPIKAELDRSMKVYHSSSHTVAARFLIPDEFYNIKPDEMKREQQLRQEATDKFGMLRTKAMRERDELKELRMYRYVLIRIRFPDGNLLQGTFRSTEKLSHVLEFIREAIVNDWIPFTLSTSTGQRLIEENLTIAQLGLAPAAVVNFAWDPDVLKEVAAQKGATQINNNCLKPELVLLQQSL